MAIGVRSAGFSPYPYGLKAAPQTRFPAIFHLGAFRFGQEVGAGPRARPLLPCLRRNSGRHGDLPLQASRYGVRNGTRPLHLDSTPSNIECRSKRG